MRLKTAGLVLAAGIAAGMPVVASGEGAVAPRAPTRVVTTSDGPVFVTPAGMTLYFSGGDQPGKSNCSDKPVTSIPDPTSGFGRYNLPGYRLIKSCAQVTPPYLAGAADAAHGDWSLIDRGNGVRQWAFQGKALYTAVWDKRPGDRNGGGTGGQFDARRGIRLAAPPSNLPAGLEPLRMGGDIVLADSNRRPLYTPRNARLQKVCLGCDDVFKPLSAPALANVAGDWSVLEPGSGNAQYAFRGKPLYSQPDSLTYRDIEETAQWDVVVLYKSEGLPSAIKTRYSPIVGDIYTTKEGRSLYLYTCTSVGCDLPGGVAALWAAMCGDAAECSRRWQPYRAEKGAKPVGEWSVVEVADPIFTDPAGTIYPAEVSRVQAWAYRGRPVYLFHEDKAPGDIFGHIHRWFGFASFNAIQIPGRGPAY